MPTLLRDRNFALLLGGETVSELGSSITYLAFPLIAVAVLHASALGVGIVAAAGNAAWLFVAIPAGVWVDRVRRRPVLIATDAGSAVVLVLVPVAWALGWLDVAVLAVAAFLIGALSVVFDVAYPAYLPSVVPSERLVAGNGWLEASSNGARIGGPGLGGILVQVVGAPVMLVADAVSFLVSATTISLMRVSEISPQNRTQTSFWTQAREGVGYVVASPVLRVLAVGVTLGNFVFGGYGAIVILFLNRQLGLHAGTIGLLTSVGGIGGVLGAGLVGRFANRVGDARALCLAAAATVPFLLMIPLTGTGVGVTWFVAGALGESVGVAAFNVCARSATQQITPPELLGRITASIRVFSRGSLPIGALVGGALAGTTSPRTALFVMLGLYALTPIWLWCSPLGRVRTVAEATVRDELPAALRPVPADQRIG